MELSFYRFGRFLRIPMLDPENEAYVSRVALLVSFVSEAVKKWELLQDETVGSPPPEAETMAYAIRKLAEMLSFEDILRLRDQDFFLYAFNLTTNPEGGPSDRDRYQRAMQVLSDGLSEVQANMDLGSLPFGSQALDWIEPSVELAEETSSRPEQDNIHQRSLDFAVETRSSNLQRDAFQETSQALSFLIM